MLVDDKTGKDIPHPKPKRWLDSLNNNKKKKNHVEGSDNKNYAFLCVSVHQLLPVPFHSGFIPSDINNSFLLFLKLFCCFSGCSACTDLEGKKQVTRKCGNRTTKNGITEIGLRKCEEEWPIDV